MGTVGLSQTLTWDQALAVAEEETGPGISSG